MYFDKSYNPTTHVDLWPWTKWPRSKSYVNLLLSEKRSFNEFTWGLSFITILYIAWQRQIVSIVIVIIISLVKYSSCYKRQSGITSFVRNVKPKFLNYMNNNSSIFKWARHIPVKFRHIHVLQVSPAWLFPLASLATSGGTKGTATITVLCYFN